MGHFNKMVALSNSIDKEKEEVSKGQFKDLYYCHTFAKFLWVIEIKTVVFLFCLNWTHLTLLTFQTLPDYPMDKIQMSRAQFDSLFSLNFVFDALTVDYLFLFLFSFAESGNMKLSKHKQKYIPYNLF